MKKILVIEDDLAFIKGIKIILEEENHRVMTETDGEKGYKRALNETFDLILLDLMLPTMNGERVCRKLRSNGIKTPIVVLTAKDSEIDEITLLKMGANDYLKKTISSDLLRARIEKTFITSDIQQPQIETYNFADISLDFKRMEATKNEQKISLMTREFAILKYLIEHAGEVVSRDDLLSKVWEEDACPTPRTVDNYILSIRKKIESDRENPKHILTIPRAGYKFDKGEED